MNIRTCKTIQGRRKLVEKLCKTGLSNIGMYPAEAERASFKNCENMIGVTHVPLGIAGPIRITSCRMSRVACHDYYLPLATTEGALVASVNRGCKAISESGGSTVFVEEVGVTRGPVFKTTGLGQSMALKKWIEDHERELQKSAQVTSAHLTLKKFGIRIAGRYVFVRFYFDTQDAMGMNMATIAASAMVRVIEKATHVHCVSLAGNFDVDKKPSWLNALSGRGKRVWAEVTLSKRTLKDTLKTTARRMYETWIAKCMVGSAMSGSMGYNAQFANVIASLFIATGQDPGHVVEGSLGVTTTEVVEAGGLSVSVYLPDLMVGTVGGGTGLAAQREALALLGVAGGNKGKNAQTFAGIVAAAVLAGEISLLASLSEGTLAAAHKRLARGKRMTNDKSINKQMNG